MGKHFRKEWLALASGDVRDHARTVSKRRSRPLRPAELHQALIYTLNNNVHGSGGWSTKLVCIMKILVEGAPASACVLHCLPRMLSEFGRPTIRDSPYYNKGALELRCPEDYAIMTHALRHVEQQQHAIIDAFLVEIDALSHSLLEGAAVSPWGAAVNGEDGEDGRQDDGVDEYVERAEKAASLRTSMLVMCCLYSGCTALTRRLLERIKGACDTVAEGASGLQRRRREAYLILEPHAYLSALKYCLAHCRVESVVRALVELPHILKLRGQMVTVGRNMKGFKLSDAFASPLPPRSPEGAAVLNALVRRAKDAPRPHDVEALLELAQVPGCASYVRTFCGMAAYVRKAGGGAALHTILTDVLKRASDHGTLSRAFVQRLLAERLLTKRVSTEPMSTEPMSLERGMQLEQDVCCSLVRQLKIAAISRTPKRLAVQPSALSGLVFHLVPRLRVLRVQRESAEAAKACDASEQMRIGFERGMGRGGRERRGGRSGGRERIGRGGRTYLRTDNTGLIFVHDQPDRIGQVDSENESNIFGRGDAVVGRPGDLLDDVIDLLKLDADDTRHGRLLFWCQVAVTESTSPKERARRGVRAPETVVRHITTVRNLIEQRQQDGMRPPMHEAEVRFLQRGGTAFQRKERAWHASLPADNISKKEDPSQSGN